MGKTDKHDCFVALLDYVETLYLLSMNDKNLYTGVDIELRETHGSVGKM